MRACACAHIAALALCVPAPTAHAQTFHIKEGDFEKGGWTFESINAAQNRFPINADRIRAGHEIGFGYGMTGYWQFKGLLGLVTPDEEHLRASRAIAENVFIFRDLPDGRDGLRLAWFQSIEAALHKDETNATIFGPVLVARAGKLEIALNPFFEKTFGRNHEEGITFLYGWQARHEVTKSVSFGIEGYGRVPDMGGGAAGFQEHRIGPVLILHGELGGLAPGVVTGRAQVGAHGAGGAKAPEGELELGVLFGMTDATPGVTGKANFHVKF